ncbi:MAG: SAM hydrolase/SAM-dependent halogenase family protein [Thermomicrobiales bacterium]
MSTQPAPPPIITLLTDFGTRGIYAGVLHGVIARLCPGATVVDLTHEVTPQAIREGAFLLAAAYRYFPLETVHVAVVDPGVGTARRAIALDVPGAGRFVGPDNGLFTPILEAHVEVAARQITSRVFGHGGVVSNTFHGRDIFAPAAAVLAGGAAFTAIGPALDRASLVRLPNFWATWETRAALGGVVRGEVVHIDRFGNLITNIRRDLFAALPPTALAAARVRTRHHDCAGIATTYGEQPPGTIVALFGSAGVLEIARVNGRADRTPRGQLIALGLPVEVTVG